jgi:O-antigen/teichoic acid export membrane protein
MLSKEYKNKIKYFINRVHLFIFGVEMGNKSIHFAKNISYSFLGGIISFGIIFLASVIAARVLGPEQYGKYAVLFSLAQMLALFFVLELDVSVLYFITKNATRKKEKTASIIMMFFINIIVFSFFASGLYYLLLPVNISEYAFFGTIVFALSFALKRMIDAFLRAYGKFKSQSVFKIAEAITVITVLLVSFYIINKQEIFSYVTALILGGIVFSVLGFMLIRKQFVVRGATTDCMNIIFKYNIFGIIGAAVNNIVKNIDKVVVIAVLGASSAGIYAVYFTATVVVGARLTQLFINVFFPVIRSNDNVNIKSVFTKINILVLKLSIPSIIIASGGVLFIILLYGSQYPLVWSWVLISGVYIVVHFFASLYGWLLSSISKRGYKQYNISFVYGFFVYCVFLGVMFLNNLFSIMVLLMALVIYRFVGGLISYMILHKRLYN